MPSYTDSAIVITRRDLGEADRIITFLSRYHGKFDAVAKGIKRLTSRKGGNLDLFNLVEIKVARGKNLDLVIEAQAINSFEELKKELSKVKEAFYLCELINNLVPEDKSSSGFFNLVLDTLKSLNTTITPQQMNELMKSFEIEFLKLSGFWSDKMFKEKMPRTLEEWRRFNRVFIEQIVGKKLRSPDFVEG
ncbi:DNA repair protein RecO [Patescibacteria group bacterium]|nr:DNA repair protein RecO [Patescibacteria group bacterium]